MSVPEPGKWNEIEGLESVASPALLVWLDRVDRNLAQMIEIAGTAQRLRPHCKTHKLAPLVTRQLELGITKQKCATIAEAEMLAEAGVRDIFWAYPPVGPNVSRLIELQRRYPDVQWRVTGDHARVFETLSAAEQAAGLSVGVLLDLDVGMHRTGIAAGSEAVRLYRQLADLPGLEPAGLHIYDGHHRQRDRQERQQAVQATYDACLDFTNTLEAEDLPVPRWVVGGTGSFPCFAALDDPRLELSPGTVIFHDMGYTRAFPDLAFEPAAWLLTRVISCPGERRVTLDLGHKAVAADPPAGQRTFFPRFPEAQEVMQSEEHLVLETPEPHGLMPGDPLLALPVHICPTTALHQEVVVIEDGRVAQRWPVTARDRRLTV